MTTMTKERTSNKQAWMMLMLAGAFEIAYALSVASSQAFTVLSWSISTLVFFLLTLFALSVALRTIDIGIGYAVWAGIGAIGSAVFGSILLDQSLTLIQSIWLAVIIIGVIWLKLTSSDKFQTDVQNLVS